MAEETQIEEVPVCIGCLTPISPLAHVCDQCGHSAGQFTPNLPLESIRYQAEFFGELWRRLCLGRDRSVTYRLGCGIFILFCHWWLFLIWPIAAYQWRHPRKS